MLKIKGKMAEIILLVNRFCSIAKITYKELKIKKAACLVATEGRKI